MPVTARQRQVYDFICRYAEAHKLPPTIAEIGRQFHMTSSASVHGILSALEREGLIKRIPNVSRGIEIIKQEEQDNDYEIPLLGTVAAGQPIEAILAHETVQAPKNMLGRDRMFALRVRGDSMIDENIQDNDIRLEPANPQFKPIFIKTPERIQIQGVVRGLIRSYNNSSRAV